MSFKDKISRHLLKRVNPDNHRYLPSYLFDGSENYHLSKEAASIYPVLCSKADFKKNSWFHISQKRGAELSGINEETFIKGIDDLKSHGIVQQKFVTKKTIHRYLYKIDFIRQHQLGLPEYKGKYFVFYTSIIEHTVWRNLTSRERVIYLTGRATSKGEYNTDNDNYRNRESDYCPLSIRKICTVGGISDRNLKSLKLLRQYGLLTSHGRDYYFHLKPDLSFLM